MLKSTIVLTLFLLAAFISVGFMVCGVNKLTSKGMEEGQPCPTSWVQVGQYLDEVETDEGKFIYIRPIMLCKPAVPMEKPKENEIVGDA